MHWTEELRETIREIVREEIKAANENQSGQEHIAPIDIGKNNWWNVTFTVLIGDEKPVDVRVTKIAPSR